MTREELEETLADARLYVSSGAAEAAYAALDMLAESAAGLAGDTLLLNSALALVDGCVWRFANDDDAAAAERALDVFFDLAGRADPDIAAIDLGRLATYRRALLASDTSAIPARRAARHANLQALFAKAQSLDGWVAECGCARGLSFLQMAFAQAERHPSWRGDGFQVFDSFEGLSQPGAEDFDTTGMESEDTRRVLALTQAGNMAFSYDSVAARILSRFPNVELHRGWLPGSLAGIPDHRYRFVHVDVDLYEPTLGCFEYFYPRLVEGGVIVTDDYNWPGGRRAVDEFCSARGLAPRLTATNQAYLVAAG